MDALITTALEPDGVLVATIDMPERTMNVFSAELMDALETLMDRVERDVAVRSVVLTSGKTNFLAGADLAMVRGYCESAIKASHTEMFELCGNLGRQFLRLENSVKPWVAAVNGIALGGGLELALACRVRLVTDDPRTRLGLPEVRLGLLPGAGGTQRLPRLIGFEPAMDLLLSGRSVSPAEAVQVGIFSRSVPAKQLLDEARAVARSLHGQPCSDTEKFAHLQQLDVPAHSDAGARDIANRHGISHDDFKLYPAYSAIIDSVLKGARLALAEATSLEMNQFLRLMFNPVAGRMVRTLFLDRLRAERELAAPPEVRIERIAVGAISPARNAWRVALDKLKLPQTLDATLAPDSIALIDQNGTLHRVSLRVLDDAPESPPSNSVLAVLAPTGPYGRVIEMIAADDASASAVAALAARLWCLPWRTFESTSVLQRMRGLALPEQAKIAQLSAAQKRASDPAFLDVAACLAGVAPAWSGGPLTWRLAQQKT